MNPVNETELGRERPRTGRPKSPITDRIDRLVEKADNGCWNWIGHIARNGYGTLCVDGKTTAAHRASYGAFVGPIPTGLDIDHLCRNRKCCNPQHLEAVTRSVNVLRASKRGAYKTHCVHGHPYDEANTGLRKDRPGQRYCRACSVKSAFQQLKQKVA